MKSKILRIGRKITYAIQHAADTMRVFVKLMDGNSSPTPSLYGKKGSLTLFLQREGGLSLRKPGELEEFNAQHIVYIDNVFFGFCLSVVSSISKQFSIEL